ncbi:MAG TPA: rRNA maturation RNase YbeY [Candidatus Paceibacterota bacterium]
MDITNKTRGTTPDIPFEKLKDTVLGAHYDLSLALVTPRQSREVTIRAKHKDKVSDVLSFPLSDASGEIIICPSVARTRAKIFHYTHEQCVARLFIHGLLHLKGYRHSDTMDDEEDKIAKKFGF